MPSFNLKRSVMLTTSLIVLNMLSATNSSIAETNHALYAKAQRSEGEFLKSVETLVNIDSGTGDEKGIRAVEMIVIDWLNALQLTVETHPANPSAGHNILAALQGTGTGRILMLAHSDTVFKKGTVARRPFKISNGKAYGPGVMDDKGGIVLGLLALKILKEINFNGFEKITFLINPDEEKGSFGSRALIKQLAKDHDYALVLEFGSPDDKVTSWRKGIGYYKLEIKGKSSHAGAEPEKGCNAMLEAAHQVLQLQEMDDTERRTTVNFTILQAGERHNIIPDFARAQADVRVLYPEEYERLEFDFKRISKNKLFPCSEVTVIADRGRPPFPPNPETNALVKKAQAIYREIGLELGVEGSGGGTDGNYAASVGAVTLDALGPVGGGAHSPEEYIAIDRIAPRLYLLARLLMDLGGG